MKNRMSNTEKSEEVLSRRKFDTKTSDSPNEPEVKKTIVVVPFQEPIRLYFSSPCLLSEIEDDEDFLNR